MRLNDPKIASLTKGEHTDSACRGLKVRVTRKLSKSFYLFYSFDGKRKNTELAAVTLDWPMPVMQLRNSKKRVSECDP